MKKAILFDLYGTLIDIKTDEYDNWVYETLSRYLSYRLINITPEELKKAYFGGVQQYLNQSKEAYPEVDVYRVFFNIVNRYGRKKYTKSFVIDLAMLCRSLTIRHFGVFEHVYDVLSSIVQRYKTAIVSDAQWVFAEPEMSILGIDQFFDLKILSSRFGFKKPDIRLFQIAVEKLGVTHQETVYIGDNPMKDLVAAKNAGIKCILFRSECFEYNGIQTDNCFYNYSELEGILNEIM